MRLLYCIVCIRDNERKYRELGLENIEYEAVENAKLAITIARGFAVCREHIHRISGCYAFE